MGLLQTIVFAVLRVKRTSNTELLTMHYILMKKNKQKPLCGYCCVKFKKGCLIYGWLLIIFTHRYTLYIRPAVEVIGNYVCNKT